MQVRRKIRLILDNIEVKYNIKIKIKTIKYFKSLVVDMGLVVEIV